MVSPTSADSLGLPRALDLLGTGPFKPFLEIERADVPDIDGQSSRPSAWFESKLNEGKPFIIRGFKDSPQWKRELLNANTLADLVDSKGDQFLSHMPLCYCC